MCRKLLCLSLLVLVSVLSLASHVSAELIARWKFDDGAGNTAVDSVGNAHPGTIGGTANWAAGQIGGALDLDGSTNYVDIQGENPIITGTFSLTMWIYARNIPTPAKDYRMPLSNDSWVDGAIHVHIWPETSIFRIDTKNGTDISSNTVIEANQWYYVAGTLDAAGESRIYIDGILDNNAIGDSKEYFIGPANIGAYQNSSRFFNGKIDDVRIYNHILSEAEIQAIMEGAVWPYADNPDPANDAIFENTWVTLSWSPGDLAVSHDVYFGTDFDDVNEATLDSDVFLHNQTLTFLVVGFPGYPYPDGLEAGTTYYWRIDEVNEADPNSPWKGPVWNFSIPPNTAYNPDPVDGAEFVDPNNATLSWTTGFGAKTHTVYFGEDFDIVANATDGIPIGTTQYSPGPLETEKIYYWRIDEYDGITTHKGDVWVFTTPGAVGNPQPTNGATDVAMATVLTWSAADNAASHEVYFGLDKDTVRNADSSSPEYKGSRTLGAENYDLGLFETNTTYYWRVDEVYDGNPVKGPVWSFTAGNYLRVDDIESYTDDDAAGQAIWQTWIDGFGVPDNGAQVGYLMPPYAEQTIVHGGAQSMPLLYTNEAGVTNSEASMTLTAPRDWTQASVAELSLWFRSTSDNAADPLYVAVSNNTGSAAIVPHDDSSVAMSRAWTQWRIPLQAFSDQGINLANVDALTIGLGSKSGMVSPGGSGTIYIDDIRLYRP